MKREHTTGGRCGYDTPIGRLVIADDGEGLTELHFAGQSDDPLRPSALTDQAAAELEQYFAGERKEFSLPLHPAGTPFQQAVWAALGQIPWGETESYRQVAERIGKPTACRAVGMANHRNPLPIFIPCHRVVGAGGALVGYAGGLEAKRLLLELEREGETR